MVDTYYKAKNVPLFESLFLHSGSYNGRPSSNFYSCFLNFPRNYMCMMYLLRLVLRLEFERQLEVTLTFVTYLLSDIAENISNLTLIPELCIEAESQPV